MVGEDVYVEYKKKEGADSFGALLYSTHEELVKNVLVAPGSQRDLVESNRPDGKIVRYTLYFPKTFDGDLKGLRIKVREHYYPVVGTPDHYSAEDTPGDWWMHVEVEDTDG